MQPVPEDDEFYDEGYDDDERVVDNRITFSKAIMYGRQRELESLHAIYNDICTNNSAEVVLISGYSGTGKSSLVQALCDKIKSETTTTTQSAAATHTGENADDNNDIKSDIENTDHNKDLPSSCSNVEGADDNNKNESKSDTRQSNDSSIATESSSTAHVTRRCFFLSGKYDDLQTADPFSAIIEAFSGFANDLVSKTKKNSTDDAAANELERIRKRAMEAVGSEGKALADVVPTLKYILGVDSDGHSFSDASTVSSVSTAGGSFSGESKQNKWNRLTFIFQQFVRSICSDKNTTVILFLDDLQWADTSSLDLITSLIRDPSIHNFMLIGAIRCNEVNEDHPVNQKFLRIVEQNTKKQIQRFDLTNLSLEDINIFISDTLGVETQEALSLTTALYSKTRGNIFFTIQVLEEWNRKHVIYYSAISFQWEWNLKEVELESSRLPDDVAGVVASKIKSVPKQLQEALTIASYTRSNFDIQTLQSLLNAIGKHTKAIDKKQLLRLLDIAVLEGLLINVIGSQIYKFAHDRIQQAAYYLIDSVDGRNNLRKQIGFHLFHRGFSPYGEDWMLFVAADHLNHAFDKDNDSKGDSDLNKLELTQLNFVVGEKALLVAAFTPASRYLQMARRGLIATSFQPWKEHYELTLRLYRAVMDVDIALGNHESGQAVGQEILQNVRTTDDALPTYLALAMASAQQERNRKAVGLIISALEVLCNFPKRFHFAHAMKEMNVVRKLLKNHSDNDILLLPKLADERQRLTSSFLYQGSIQAFLCGDFHLALLFVSLGVQIGFNHGLCAYHAHACIGYGILVSGHLNDEEMGLRLSRLAKEILAICDKNKEVECNVFLCRSTFFDSWSLPANDVFENFRRGHIAGMQSGDIDFGLRNAVWETFYVYLFGYPLKAIEQATAKVTEKILSYNVESALGVVLEMRYLYSHLIGFVSSPDSGSPKPTHLDWRKIENYGVDQDDSSGAGIKLSLGLQSRLQLAVYFDELEVAEKLADRASKVFQVDTQFHGVVIRLVFSGLAYSGLLRKTKKRKYKGLARKMVVEMKKKKGKNCRHRYLLMEADLKSFGEKRILKVCQLYDEAISAAFSLGFKQDAALGSELAAKHLLTMGNNELVEKYFKQARDLYRDWGAMKKVEHLESKHGFLLPSNLVEKAKP